MTLVSRSFHSATIDTLSSIAKDTTRFGSSYCLLGRFKSFRIGPTMCASQRSLSQEVLKSLLVDGNVADS
jgi:hypothetical protein